jgi:hypothetical protein
MTDIFVSYRRDDSQCRPRFGAERVFFDTVTIRPGKDFREVLGAKVGA